MTAPMTVAEIAVRFTEAMLSSPHLMPPDLANHSIGLAEYLHAELVKRGHIKPEPAPNGPDWSKAPPKANWRAQDADGKWHWYEYEPVLRDSDWWPSKDGSCEEDLTYRDNWRESLQRRPGSV